MLRKTILALRSECLGIALRSTGAASALSAAGHIHFGHAGGGLAPWLA